MQLNDRRREEASKDKPVSGSMEDGSAERKRRKIIERISLGTFILIIWGLLVLPIIFYHLPVPQDEDEQNSSVLSNGTIGAQSYFPCRESFFHEQQYNICVPSCPSWRQEPAAISILIDVVVFLAYFTGFVAAIAVLIISIIRHDSMFTFPNILIVYMTTVYSVQNLFYVVTFFDRAKLYCSSENWFETFSHVTPFCVISGMVQVYSTLSGSLWWFMLATTLFWKIQFPFHSRSFQTTNKMKYLHIGCCLAGLLIPLIPVIALMSGYGVRITSSGRSFGLGFTYVRFPPLPCNGNNHVILYYSLVLPTNILLAIGITFIILILRIVHKQIGLFKKKKTTNILKIGSSERKILLIICYYIVTTVINLTAFANISRSVLFRKRLAEYFACERFGHDPSNPCDRQLLEGTIPSFLVMLSYGFHGTLPFVNLIFAININDLKMKCIRCFTSMKITGMSHKNTSSTTAS